MEQHIDAFISHHTSTCLPVTQAICNTLESSGIRCWYAPRDTEGAYASSIVSAIDRCSVFILVLNRESSLSQDVLNEINLAVERIRRGDPLTILPFQISSDEIGSDAKYYISRIHWIDAVTPPMEERLRELKLRVTAVLRKSDQYIPSDRASLSDRGHASPALKSTALLPNGNFVGRDRELELLHQSLEGIHKVFLQGMGGIGKSELAKAYAIRNSDRYHTVIFATYRDSLLDLLVHDPGFRIDALPRACDDRGLLESDSAYLDRKLCWLRENTDEHTLLIIDNFDTDEDPHLEAFLNGPYSVIITTRNDHTELGLPVLPLSGFRTEAEQLALFSHYYRRPVPDRQRPTVCRILETVAGHTLAIELIAKFMLHRHMTPEKMLALLQEQGVGAMTAGTLSHGFGKAQSGYANIRQLFDLYGLTDGERHILQNLSLMPLTGLDFVVFADLCELENFEALDGLIRKSWVSHSISDDTVALHPLIRDVIHREHPPTREACAPLIRNLTARLKQIWSMPLEDRRLYCSLGRSLYAYFPEVTGPDLNTYIAIATALTILEQFDLSHEILRKCQFCCREYYGEHSPEAAEICYRFADDALHRNDAATAAALLEQAIAILEQAAPGSERLAYMIKFLCWTRLAWFSDHEETERLLHRSHRILAAQDPINPSQMASQNAAYANVYYLMGQYDRALSYADSSYREFCQLHGELHGDTLAPMGIKSRILSRMGQGDTALALIDRVIDIQLQLDEPLSQRVLNRYEAKAEIYENLGDAARSREMLEMILTLLAQKQDSTSPFYRRIRAKFDA